MSSSAAGGDTPQISGMTYGSSTINPSIMLANATTQAFNQLPDFFPDYTTRIATRIALNQPKQNPQQQNMTNPTRRIVQVFIADPNENAPLEHSILYKGDQKLTDLTDTELFFEVPITDLLADHNTKRRTWLDKEASKRAGKDVYLDPVKIRDLKMVVVTIAQF